MTIKFDNLAKRSHDQREYFANCLHLQKHKSALKRIFCFCCLVVWPKRSGELYYRANLAG